MMLKNLLLSLVINFTIFNSISIGASATDKSVPEVLEYKIVYGDRESTFIVTQVKDGGMIQFSNNLNQNRKSEISGKNLKYLKDELLYAKGLSNSKEFCPRSYIEAKLGNKALVGCLGAKNQMALQLQKSVSMLELVLE